MDSGDFDVAIAGGGLAGGLIALAIHRAAPQLRLAIIEGGANLGGNHRWSWFASDISERGTGLLALFAAKRWDEGYDVRFPSHQRTLGSSYRSLSSVDFHAALTDSLPQDSIMLGAQIAALDAHGVELADGDRLNARLVIDCRGFTPSPHLCGGWQVFLGQHWRLSAPHSQTRPTIMDASVQQSAPYGNGNAYRFVYALPINQSDIFLEDTYYADEPRLDRATLATRVANYASDRGWQGEIIGEETGILPVITGGNFAAYQRDQRIDGVAIAGARGGFAHPLTSYTLPVAVDTALAIADRITASNALPSGPSLALFCEARAQRHWENTRYYRMLARMLFHAAEPARRFVIFERFYRLSEALIERFYAGNSTLLDRVRILVGKPPVPLLSAITALAHSGHPLTTEKSA